ncbi:MAG: phosphate ABC transporter permease subunit PstC [Nautiliaceae bacterium]
MENFFKKLSAFSATTILFLLTGIFVVLFLYAKPAIKEYGFKFLIDPRWGVSINPNKLSNNQDQVLVNQDSENIVVEEEDIGGDTPVVQEENIQTDEEDIAIKDEDTLSQNSKVIYGGLIPIVGTILSTIIAMAFAVPIAMGIAIFLSEIAPPFISKPVGVAIELLAAIPSIIYGMWGLFYFGPVVSKIFGGGSVSLLVAGLVLGIMIIPFMASLSRDSMNTTPNVLKESAYAMGATKFEVIKDVIFPYAKSGIIGSMILALGRALGETMAVAFVIGGVFKLPEKITDPTVSIPVVLANNFAESSGMSLSALFYLALILFVISFLVISFAKFYFLRDKK